jgi:hypothetical protein
MNLKNKEKWNTPRENGFEVGFEFGVDMDDDDF